MTTVRMKVKGMSCSHCERRVADALKKAGASDSVVSAKDGSATVTFDPDKVSPQQLAQAVRDAGYEVVEVIPT
ncbi:MAG TPA: heavy-metal-associated domain-containing protein [Firmicutes bacterium]|nr:heavy-metal-associated domain-containing protein [Candidatus Fermentithermobacillaceae bacterium]